MQKSLAAQKSDFDALLAKSKIEQQVHLEATIKDLDKAYGKAMRLEISQLENRFETET